MPMVPDLYSETEENVGGAVSFYAKAEEKGARDYKKIAERAWVTRREIRPKWDEAAGQVS